MSYREFLDTLNVPAVVPGYTTPLKYAVDTYKPVDGVLEFGVFTGQTVNYLASKVDSPVHGFDTFTGLPEEWRPGFPKGCFGLNKLPTVLSNVVLHKGLFQDTLEPFLESNKSEISFVHIDCDIYSSTKYVLDTLIKSGQLKKGCILVFDELINYRGYQDLHRGELHAFYDSIVSKGVEYTIIGGKLKNQANNVECHKDDQGVIVQLN